MKKYLLPKDGNFYKANLHMHTNISDGKMTIEETKEIYKKAGYSIVAFTDHEIMVPHNELTDDDFLAITSTEISVNENYTDEFEYLKCYHLNIYSQDPNRKLFSGFSVDPIWLKHSLDYLDDNLKDVHYDRKYTTECINEIIENANKEGCLVSLNHPVWSLQNREDYIDLKGLWGVEWFNSGCIRDGYVDTMQPIDDLLRVGQNVFPLATDDAHNINHCFGGFVNVKAANLKYETIFNALKNGDFYSSSGPEIYDLYIEDGIINIKTSKVRQIFVSTERRYTCNISNKDGVLEEAKLDINYYLNKCRKTSPEYIRITIIDKNGYKAHTRAYYLNELIGD